MAISRKELFTNYLAEDKAAQTRTLAGWRQHHPHGFDPTTTFQIVQQVFEPFATKEHQGTRNAFVSGVRQAMMKYGISGADIDKKANEINASIFNVPLQELTTIPQRKPSPPAKDDRRPPQIGISTLQIPGTDIWGKGVSLGEGKGILSIGGASTDTGKIPLFEWPSGLENEELSDQQIDPNKLPTGAGAGFAFDEKSPPLQTSIREEAAKGVLDDINAKKVLPLASNVMTGADLLGLITTPPPVKLAQLALSLFNFGRQRELDKPTLLGGGIRNPNLLGSLGRTLLGGAFTKKEDILPPIDPKQRFGPVISASDPRAFTLAKALGRGSSKGLLGIDPTVGPSMTIEGIAPSRGESGPPTGEGGYSPNVGIFSGVDWGAPF
jgi:hypothetical protein